MRIFAFCIPFWAHMLLSIGIKPQQMKALGYISVALGFILVLGMFLAGSMLTLSEKDVVLMLLLIASLCICSLMAFIFFALEHAMQLVKEK